MAIAGRQSTSAGAGFPGAEMVPATTAAEPSARVSGDGVARLWAVVWSMPLRLTKRERNEYSAIVCGSVGLSFERAGRWPISTTLLDSEIDAREFVHDLQVMRTCNEEVGGQNLCDYGACDWK